MGISMKGKLRYSAMFITSALALGIFLFLIHKNDDTYNKGKYILCTMESDGLICVPSDRNTISGMKVSLIKDYNVYIYDDRLFNKEVIYTNYVNSDGYVSSLNEIELSANKPSSGDNKVKIKKIDPSLGYEVINDLDDNYTDKTVDIDGRIIFLSDSDKRDFDNFYSKVISKYDN